MTVDVAAVRHVAGLARLALTDTEAAALAVDLGAILELVARIAENDAGDVAPAATSAALRPDEPVQSDPDALLALCADVQDGLFTVDRILPAS